MPNINITVREKIAHTISDTCIVCGNSDYVAVFDFDAEWDAYETKTARFIWGGTFTDVPFTGNECPVPVIPDAVSVLVGVYAGELRTTTAAAVEVRRSILGGSETEAEVSHEIKDAFGKMLAGKIDAPQTAQVGEVLTVEEVDTEGKPKKWKMAPAAAEQKQADWAQNDPTAADYVQNRPGGYYGDPVTVDEEIYSGEIEQDQSEMLVDWLLVAGQTYKVTIGEVTKTYTAFADSFRGFPGVTIGDGTIEDAAKSGEMFALFSAENKGNKAALLACTEADVGKTIRVTQFGTAREVHKIPAELLDIPSVEQVVTVRLVERDGKQYGSIPFNEVLAAQRGGKEVRLLDNDGHYFQFTGIYNAEEDICFHSFRLRTLWIAIMERSGFIEIFDHSIGQQELTYNASSTYTRLFDEKSFSHMFSSVWTRMKFFITLRLLTRTAGAYVQLRYDKGRKILNICKHEEIGTDKAILCGELEKTTTGNYTYLVTLRLRSEDGTPHPARFDFCDELNLDSGDTDSSPRIEILSGTEDKFEDRQSVRKYGR
nr:MAG TPA: hypothetical protein [Caudoviricetes sp.]